MLAVFFAASSLGPREVLLDGTSVLPAWQVRGVGAAFPDVCKEAGLYGTPAWPQPFLPGVPAQGCGRRQQRLACLQLPPRRGLRGAEWTRRDAGSKSQGRRKPTSLVFVLWEPGHEVALDSLIADE